MEKGIYKATQSTKGQQKDIRRRGFPTFRRGAKELAYFPIWVELPTLMSSFELIS